MCLLLKKKNFKNRTIFETPYWKNTPHTWEYQPRMTNTNWTVKKKRKKIPWASRQKQQVTYKENKIRASSDFNCNVLHQKKMKLHIWYVHQTLYIYIWLTYMWTKDFIRSKTAMLTPRTLSGRHLLEQGLANCSQRHFCTLPWTKDGF